MQSKVLHILKLRLGSMEVWIAVALQLPNSVPSGCLTCSVSEVRNGRDMQSR